MNLARNLEQAARFFPGFPAMVERGRATTYAALEAQSNRVAGALVGLGLEPGDHVARQERSGHEDRVLCFLPLHHVFGQVHVMLSTILTAGCLEMLPAFDLDEVLAVFGRGEVTKFYAVPTVYLSLLGQGNLKERLGKVRYCFSAAASMALEVVREWKEVSGLDIHEAYGMTESASMVTYNHYYRHKVGSVGTPVGSVEVAIMDQEGNLLPQGRDGEICIQGPNIMKGYLNRPEETARAFWGPWFRSGDVGHLDKDGYLYIVDRIKDMIITGGENVYPREIEELLYQRPEVAECAVVGLPDREYGEQVTAVIVPKPGAELEPEDLRAYLRERLSGFKVPKAFVVVPDLPRSAAGKILKRVLKDNITRRPPTAS
ncbi:MAG: AMP-binding protein [Desulfarculus sp.]|nr:AMP-binding protein [Desulfarculus sp.]MBV1738159.1 AMP-binding protein [Desulfarculus sp.]MBV1753287.1 AMP-binding protein [Desulfarculus sp.]